MQPSRAAPARGRLVAVTVPPSDLVSPRASHTRMNASVDVRSVALTPLPARAGERADEGLEQVDRQREDDGAVLLGGDLGQGLQVAQLQGGRLAADHLRSSRQLLAGAELAL